MIMISSLMGRMCSRLSECGYRVIVVGGAVRDGLLGLPIQDIDLEVFGACELAELTPVLSEFGAVCVVGQAYQVIKVTTSEGVVDVSLPRVEVKVAKGHRGFITSTDPKMDFKTASSRRDFTINAMGYDPITGEILDPFNGQKDLEAKVLKHVGPAFKEDPLRVFRAVQLVGRFGLSIAPETVEVCRQLPLDEVPMERIFAEFSTLLDRTQTPSLGFRAMAQVGVTTVFKEFDLFLQPPDWEFLHALDWLASECRYSKVKGQDRVSVLLGFIGLRLGKDGCRAMMDRLTRDRAVRDRVFSLVDEEITPDILIHIFGLLQNIPSARFSKGSTTPSSLTLRLLGSPRPLINRTSGTFCNSPTFCNEFDTCIRRLSLRVRISDWVMTYRALGGYRHFMTYVEHRAKQFGIYDRPLPALILGRHVMALGVPAGRKVGYWVSRAYQAQLDGEFDSEEGGIEWVRGRVLGNSL